jgi:hypothetical protein
VTGSSTIVSGFNASNWLVFSSFPAARNFHAGAGVSRAALLLLSGTAAAHCLSPCPRTPMSVRLCEYAAAPSSI